MPWPRVERPRHPVLAARLGLGFIGTAALVQLAQTAATPLDNGMVGVAFSYGVPTALLLCGLALLRWAHRIPGLAWLGVPVAGLVAIVSLDVTSNDTSVLGQVFLFFPLLFASSQLAPRAALLVALLAVVSEAVITFAGEPPTQALVDTLVMSAALGTAAVLQVHSAAEQSRLVDRLAAIARVDALTGLASRRSLDAELADALSGGPDRRRSGESDGTALLLVDLDFFKSVNDEHGHPVGDDYLVHVAAFLSSRFRSQDVVARLGGDEFAVLMRRSSRTDAFAVAQGLLAAAPAHPLVLGDGTRLPLRFTVGVGHVQPDDEPSVRDLYADADRALYTAKQAGRGQVR